MNKGYEPNIDVILIIDGDYTEGESELKGLTQTMKKVFVKELDQVKDNLKLSEERTRASEERTRAQLE